MARAISMYGPAGIVLDLDHGFDILNADSFRALVSLLGQRSHGRCHVRGVCLAAPCESFSMARRAPLWSRFPHALRSAEHPCGLPELSGTDRLVCSRGNRLARKTAKLIAICMQHKIPWLLENPKSSFLWRFPAIERALKSAQCVVVDQCQYGCPWMKPTMLAMSPLLCPTPSLCKRCRGRRGVCSRTGLPHTVLTGTDKGVFRTAAAKVYPKALCRAIANTFRTCWAVTLLGDKIQLLNGITSTRMRTGEDS